MTEETFVTGIALSQWAHGAARLGLPSLDIMKRCDLDPLCLGDLGRKIPLSTFENFMLELILVSGDELLGLHIGQQIMPALYGSLSMVVLSADSLEDGFRMAARYAPMVVGNAGGVEIREDDNDKLFIGLLAHKNAVVRRHWIESVAALIIKAAKFMFPSFSPECLYFEHAPTSKHMEKSLLEYFRCPIQFGASFNGARFDAKKMAGYVNGYGKYSMEIASKLADQQLEDQKIQQTFIDRIKIQIRDLIGTTSPRREVVAERLGISPRTLDRRLSSAGYSWQELIDAIRSQLAYEYLSKSDENIADIAHRIGFSDVRAFQRRFRKWSGVSPNEYRKSFKR